MKKFIKIILVVIVVFCAIGIFSNSSENYKESNSRSYSIVYKLNIKNPKTEYKLNKVIRKCAHITEYMVFTLIVLFTLKSFKVERGYRILIALLVCILLGLTDEYYQSFIPGRGSKVSDVFIDFFGGILACIFYTIGEHIKKIV